MRKLVIALMGGALILGLLVAGCGGDDGDAAADAPTVEKAEFIEQVDAICAKQWKETVAELQAAITNAETTGQGFENEGIDLEVEILTPILIKGVEAQTEEILAVGLPDGEEKQAEKILDAYGTWLKKAEGSPLKIVVANDVYNEARVLAGKYGLPACERDPFEL